MAADELKVLGAALRERVDSVVKAALEADRPALFEAIETAAGRAVAQRHMAWSENAGCRIATLEKQAAALEEDVARARAVADVADLAKLRAEHDDIRLQAGRLAERREALIEEAQALRKARESVDALARDVIRAQASAETLAEALTLELGRLAKSTEERAAVAAQAAVDGLRASLEEVTAAALLAVSKAAEARVGLAAAAAEQKAETAASEAVAATKAAAKAAAAEVRKAGARVDGVIEAWKGEAQAALADIEARGGRVIDEMVAKSADPAMVSEELGSPLVPRGFRGAWTPGSKYSRGDLVMFQGSTFIAARTTKKSPNQDSPAPVSLAKSADSGTGGDWQMFASGGIGGGFAGQKRLRPGQETDTLPGLLYQGASADVPAAASDADQPWFGSAGGAIAVAATTYLLRGFLRLESNATPHGVEVGFGGTAVVSLLAGAALSSVGPDGAPVAGQESTLLADGSMTPVQTSVAATVRVVEIDGVVTFSQAGSFVPMLRYTAAPGTPVVAAGSHIALQKLPAVAKPTHDGSRLPPIELTLGVPMTINGAAGFSGTGVTYSATGLPPGLSIDPLTGVISGVPLAAVDLASVVVIATNAAGSAMAPAFTMQVSSGLPSVIPLVLADATGVLGVIPADERPPVDLVAPDAAGAVWTISASTGEVTANLSAYAGALAGVAASVNGVVWVDVLNRGRRLETSVLGVTAFGFTLPATGLPAAGSSMTVGQTLGFVTTALAPAPFTLTGEAGPAASVANGIASEKRLAALPAGSPAAGELLRIDIGRGQPGQPGWQSAGRFLLTFAADRNALFGEIWADGSHLTLSVPMASDPDTFRAYAMAMSPRDGLVYLRALGQAGVIGGASASLAGLPTDLVVGEMRVLGRATRTEATGFPVASLGVVLTGRMADGDRLVEAVTSNAAPIRIAIADNWTDASVTAALTAAQPPSSAPSVVDPDAFSAALGAPSVGVETVVALPPMFTGGLAPRAYTASVGSVVADALRWTPSVGGQTTVEATQTDARGLSATVSAVKTVQAAIDVQRSYVAGDFVTIDLREIAAASSYVPVGTLPAWLEIDGDLGELYSLSVPAGAHSVAVTADGVRINLTLTVAAARPYAAVAGGARMLRTADLGAAGPGTSGLITFAARMKLPSSQRGSSTTFFALSTVSATSSVFRINPTGQFNISLRPEGSTTPITNRFTTDTINFYDDQWHTVVVEAKIQGLEATKYLRFWVDGVEVAQTATGAPPTGLYDVDPGGGYTALSGRNGSEPFPATAEIQWLYVNFTETHSGPAFVSADPKTVGSPHFFFGGTRANWQAGTNFGSAGGAFAVTGIFIETAPAVVPDPTPIAYEAAVGFGRVSAGGRDKPLFIVDSLSNGTGVGTLRWALAQAALPGNAGGRIKIVAEGAFRHGDWIRVEADNVTIDARHAPGMGFWIERAGLLVNADDVVVRGIRAYPGSDFMPPSTSGRDAVRIDGGARIAIDQCDMMFALDETFSAWSYVANQPIANVTLQRSLLADALFRNLHVDETLGIDEHSMGMIFGRATSTAGTAVSNITVVDNIFCGMEDRLPLNSGAIGVEVVRNIFADFGAQSVAVSEGMFTDVYDNLWLRSPQSPFSGTGVNATSWRRVATATTTNETVYADGDLAGHIDANGDLQPSLTGGWRNGTTWAGGAPMDATALDNPALFTKSGVERLPGGPLALLGRVDFIGARSMDGARHPHAARVVANLTAEPPFPNATWFQRNYGGDSHAPDELRAVGATIASPAAGRLVVTLPNANVVLPPAAGRPWSSVEVAIVDAYSAPISGGESALPLRAGANWDTPFTVGGVTRETIRQAGSLTGGDVVFDGIPAGNYAVRVIYTAGSFDLRLHSGRPFAVASGAVAFPDILDTLSPPDLTDRAYMAGPQHVVIDVTDATLVYGGLTTDPAAVGPTVYRAGDRDQPVKQAWGDRINRAPWWAAFQSPDGVEIANDSPLENAITAAVASGATATALPGMIPANYSVRVGAAAPVAPSGVYRWSAMEQATRRKSDSTQIMRHRHRITLALPAPVADGQTVEVTYGGVTLSCVAGADQPSDLIGVSQIGYERLGKKRVVVGQWLGSRPSAYLNSGSTVLQSISTDQTLPASKTWVLRNTDTGAVAASGSLTEQVGGDSITLDGGLVHTTGAKIYVADFDNVTEPGHYRVEVAGVGCSPIFEIRDGIFVDIARVCASGLDNTRRAQAYNTGAFTFSHPAYDVANLRWPHIQTAIRIQATDEGPGAGAYPSKYDLLNADPTITVSSIAGDPAILTMAQPQAADWQPGKEIATAHLGGVEPNWWGRTYVITERISNTQFRLNAAAPTQAIGTQARAGLAETPNWGWRDAADADSRRQHAQAERALIRAVLFSTSMAAAALRQPETGGYTRPVRLLGSASSFVAPAGMSPMLNTAAWSLDTFCDLQLANGWVRGGAELSRYLNVGDGGTGLALPANAASYIYAPEAYATWEQAATAALMAFVLDRRHPGNQLSARYRTSAIAAWQACTSSEAEAQLVADGRTAAVTPLRTLAPLCLWLMTPGSAGNVYRDAFFAALAGQTSAEVHAEAVGLWLWAHAQGIVSYDPTGTTVTTWVNRARDVALTMASVGRPFAGMTIIPSNGRYSNSLGIPNWTAERGVVAALAAPLMSAGDRSTVLGIVGPWAAHEMLFALGANPAGTTTISGVGARPPRSQTYRDYEALGAEIWPYGIPQFGPASQADIAAAPSVYNTHATRRGYPAFSLTPWAANWNGQRNFAPMTEWTPFACHADWLTAVTVAQLVYRGEG